jgi:Gluconate 2-dehydrogenase subunit 3
MNYEPELPIIVQSQDSLRGVTRREMLQKVLAGLGATLAGSATALAHPLHKYLSDPASLEVASAKVAGKSWSPEFLDRHQNATLVALAEGIVPGSKVAQVNRMIDLLLTIDTVENQQSFIAALAAFDAESTKHFNHPIQSLKSSELDALLSTCSTAKPSRSTEDNVSTAHNDKSLKPQPQGPPTLCDHFENLKGWIVTTYYSSEIGMRELGWTEHVFFRASAECSHSESEPK